jgi:hypothetical protein
MKPWEYPRPWLLPWRALLDGVEAVDDDAVRLQGQRLSECRRAAADRASAIKRLHGPAKRRGRFLDALGDAQNAAVLHVGAEDDDGLAFSALGAGGWSVPLFDLAGVFGDDCLRVGHGIGKGRCDEDWRCKGDCRNGNAVFQNVSADHVIPPVELLAG